MRFTEKTESPTIYHLWIATGVVGAAMARNIYIDMGHFKIFPNNYVILCAGSAKCRKSVAIEIGMKLLDTTGRRILSEKITPEMLIKQLGRIATEGQGANQHVFSVPLVVYSDELGIFMSNAAQQSGMPLLLTRLYTCPDKFEYMTKGSGSDRLREPCLNLFAGTTPDWLQDHVGPDVFSEGFIGRTLFIYSDEPRPPIAFPVVTKEERKLWDLMVEQLRGISEIKGVVQLTEEARDYYTHWYTHREIDDAALSMSGFYEREHVHVLKIAMIYAVSAGDALTVSQPHVEAAIIAMRHITQTMSVALLGAGYDLSVRHVAVLEKALQERTIPMSYIELYKRVYKRMTREMYDSALAALVDAGRIQRLVKSVNGKPVDFYAYVKL